MITAAIPDGDAMGLSQTFSISSNDIISDLDVSTQINYSWVGDLIVSLRHEDSATEVVLIDRPGVPATNFGCSGDDIDVSLDDEAASSVENECAPSGATISGNFQPNNALSAFDGESLGGSWTLRVSDNAVGDTGSLITWCLTPTTIASNSVFMDGFE